MARVRAVRSVSGPSAGVSPLLARRGTCAPPTRDPRGTGLTRAEHGYVKRHRAPEAARARAALPRPQRQRVAHGPGTRHAAADGAAATARDWSVTRDALVHGTHHALAQSLKIPPHCARTCSLFNLVDSRARLVLLDGAEELMEVTLAEAAAAGRLGDGLVRLRVPRAANALNDLEEEG